MRSFVLAYYPENRYIRSYDVDSVFSVSASSTASFTQSSVVNFVKLFSSSNAVSLSQSATFNIYRVEVSSNSFSLSQTIVSTNILNITETDSLSLSQSVSQIHTVPLSVSSSLTLTHDDLFFKAIQAIPQSFTLSQSVSKYKVIPRTGLQTLSFTQRFNKSLSKRLSSVLSFTQSLRKAYGLKLTSLLSLRQSNTSSEIHATGKKKKVKVVYTETISQSLNLRQMELISQLIPPSTHKYQIPVLHILNLVSTSLVHQYTLKSVSDTLSLTSSVLPNTALIQSIEQNITFSDEQLTYDGDFLDPLFLTQQVVLEFDNAEGFTSPLSLVDEAVATKVITEVAIDYLNVADSFSTHNAIKQHISDQLTFTQVTSSPVIQHLTLTQGLSANLVPGQIAHTFLFPSQSVVVNKSWILSAVSSLDISGRLNEVRNFSTDSGDLIFQQRIDVVPQRFRTGSSTLSFSETVVENEVTFHTSSDSLTFTESATYTHSFARQPRNVDHLTFIQSLSKTLNNARSYTQNLFLIQSVSSTKVNVVSDSDSFTLSQSAISQKIAPRSVTSTLSLSESVKSTRPLSNALVLSQSVLEFKVSIRSLTSTVSLSESLSGSGNNVSISLSQSFTISQTLSKVPIYKFTSALILSESVSLLSDRLRDYLQNLPFNQTLSFTKVNAISLSSYSGFTEQVDVFKAFPISIIQSLSITDNLEIVKEESGDNLLSINQNVTVLNVHNFIPNDDLFFRWSIDVQKVEGGNSFGNDDELLFSPFFRIH